MAKIKILFEAGETYTEVSSLTNLRFAQPTISQLKEAYNDFLLYLDELAEESDPDVTETQIAIALIKPNFEDLTIEKILVADYDYLPNPNNPEPYRAIHLITFGVIINRDALIQKYREINNSEPDFSELDFFPI